MSGITREMVRAAYAFESAAIDAGFDQAKVDYQSPAWTLGETKLRISGVDSKNKRHEYVEGDSDA